MDLKHVRQCLDHERRTLARNGEAIETLPHVTRIRTTNGSRHAISFSALSSDNADAVIAEQTDYLRAQSGEVEWKVYGYDQPADILQRLSGRGFEVGPCEAVLVLDLHDRPAWADVPGTIDVVRVTDLEQVELFQRLSEEIFRWKSRSTAEEIAHGITEGSTEHLGYIAYDHGIPASIGRLYTHRDSLFGGLYGGGTLPQHRGRGAYRAVVAVRAGDAVELGARYLIVDALPTSRPILERLGFVYLTDTWPCVLRCGREGERIDCA
jgi:hypothetical protein